MIKANSGAVLLNGLRRASAAPAVAKPVSGVLVDSSENGVKICSMAAPELQSGIARVVAVLKSGSRNEVNSSDRGLAHLIRRSFGLSTPNYTAVNLTRHLEQMGAKVTCHGTREHLIYTVDAAPNLIARAGYILGNLASDPAFYQWELKDTVYKLMKHDIDLLQRHDFGALCNENLYEAAFGNHPDGTRLGRSLFSTYDRLGTYSLDQIVDYHSNAFQPTKCAISLMHNSTKLDTKKAFAEIISGFHFKPPKSVDVPQAKHDFLGNDVRRDIAICPTTTVMMATHVTFGKQDRDSHLSLAIAAHAMHGALSNISFADGSGSSSLLARTAGAGGFEDYLTQCGALYHAHSDHGLFGFSMVGSCGRATGARVAEVAKALKALAKNGLSLDEVNRGKSLLKIDIAIKNENKPRATVDLALQALESGKYSSVDDLSLLIDELKPETVNQTLKKVLSTNKAALSVVGANTALVPPLQVLMSA